MPTHSSELGVRWFEEPTQPENIAGCAELARRTRVPIAGFETETSKFNFAALIDAGAIQMVQPDVIQVGGITEARKIAAYAQMRHLAVHLQELQHGGQPRRLPQSALRAAERRLFRMRHGPIALAGSFLRTPLFAFDGWHGSTV